MIVFAWYLLKVLIVSGILCGYYFLALKDKIFHKWNRFYLLFTIALSLLLPFVSINLLQPATEQGTVIKVLQAVTVQDEIVIELGKKSLLTTDTLIIAGYTLISLALIATLLLTLLRIYRIKKRYPRTEVEGINFINTDAKGTPFSFFNSIFWNRSIDLHSVSGQQIFNHEIAHVKEKHSYDKIFINIVLLFFWANPFFWIIRKELNMIHEFIADKAALEDGDVNAFAEMILSSVYPGQQLSITNNFFYSPVKRRLLMLLKNKNPKVNYLSRLLVLPLAAIVFMAFALKMKTIKPAHIYNGDAITVVIDAGHGGQDAGASSEGINEKDLSIAIAKNILELNTNKKINILLSRENDQTVSVKDRVNFAIKKKADLFVSIHINSQMGGKSANGLDVIIPKKDNVYFNKSELLGSAIVQSFKNNSPLKISENLVQLASGVWVLKANQFPAVLVQAGFITSEKDLSYLSKTENQKEIALKILKGIENYAAQISISSIEPKQSIEDTSIPKMMYKNKRVTSLEVRPSKKNISVTYDDGSTEMIDKAEADKRGFVLPPPPPPSVKILLRSPSASTLSKLPENALYEVDGKEANRNSVAEISPDNIESIEVFKGEQAIKLYGKKGANGVIKINTKSATKYSVREDDNSTLTTDKKLVLLELNHAVNFGNPLILLNDKEISKAEINEIPQGSISSINHIKGKAVIDKYGPKANEGVFKIITKNKSENATSVSSGAKTNYGGGFLKQTDTVPNKIFNGKITKGILLVSPPDAVQIQADELVSAESPEKNRVDPLKAVLIINGKEVPNETLRKKWITAKKVTIYQGDKPGLTAKYGDKAKNGVIIFEGATVKNTPSPGNPSSSTDIIFTKVEHEAEFPGGKTAWLKYVTGKIMENQALFTEKDFGKCMIKFIVDVNGNVSDVKATTMEGSTLAKIAIDAIRNGPKWFPAMQNGRKVNAYREQPITLSNPDAK